MKEKIKRRFGDRKDGRLIRDLDPMHFIVPLIHPNRCDNEAYISERIDLEKLNAYLESKNAANPEFKYTLFHIIVIALIKTITLRPKMNRFIANKNVYQRNEVSAAFVVKKQFADESAEGLAFVHSVDEDTLESIHDKIYRQVHFCRGDKADASSDFMDIFNRMPRFISKSLVWMVTKLDKHGICPASLIQTDPYYSSALISNIGSIKMKCGYHHLTNWGTNSVFCIIGEKKMTPSAAADGNSVMRETVDIGMTIDERLADGYYYSKTIRLLKHLLQNPELLEAPMNQPVEEY